MNKKNRTIDSGVEYNAVRTTHSIGEWMDHIEEWKGACETGNAECVCTTCVGALHPVFSATTRHLQQLLSNKQSTVNLGALMKLSMETEELFDEVHGTFNDLLDVESAGVSSDKVAEREKRDIRIIAKDIRALVDRFELAFPDIRSHMISTGVRQMTT